MSMDAEASASGSDRANGVDTGASLPPVLSPPGSSHSNQSTDVDDVSLAIEPLQLPPPTPQGTKHENPPPLQVANGDPDGLDPIGDDDLDPGSFDLVMPGQERYGAYGKHKLEERSELVFSRAHLRAIFDKPAHLHRFSAFLYRHRHASVPLLTYYLNAVKALRAIEYSNAVVNTLGPLSDFAFTHDELVQAPPSANRALREKADAAFDVLVQEDLPMYITHVWIQTVTVSIRQRIMGTPHHESEGLAEVFCLTDPSRWDNPIVFMSEQFNRTTQYGVDYVIGRNCRFLQGPSTNPFSVRRIRERLAAGKEHYETFLNYRRDGSPFMNLVMLAPLYDSRGHIRYFIGAQVDVSGLAMNCYDLDSLQDVVEQQQGEDAKEEFTRLAEMFSTKELETVRAHGGEMHRQPLQSDEKIRRKESKKAASSTKPITPGGNRVVLDNSSPDEGTTHLSHIHNGRLTGVYGNYLLVRPYPSLRILFTSPSMRVPGILQSPLLERIGGSSRMREQLLKAFSEGQSVTAKVRWLNVSHKSSKTERKAPAGLEARPENEGRHGPELPGRPRWLHCTPLVGASGTVGVWMIVIVDDEPHPSQTRQPPSISLKSSITEDFDIPDPEESQPEESRQEPSRPDPSRPEMSRPEMSLLEKSLPRPPLPAARRSSDTLEGPPVAKVRRNTYKSLLASKDLKSLKSRGQAAGRFFNLAALSRASLASAHTQGEQVRVPLRGERHD